MCVNVLCMSYKNQVKSGLFLVFFVFLAGVFFLWPKSASAMNITIGIPAKYSEINAGEAVYFETVVKWPENSDRKDLRIEYSVKNKDGVEVAYTKVLKAIETQASFIDSISIPESLEPGMYVISANINDYGNLNEEVKASFYVAKHNDMVLNLLFIILGALGLIALLIFIEFFIILGPKTKCNTSR